MPPVTECKRDMANQPTTSIDVIDNDPASYSRLQQWLDQLMPGAVLTLHATYDEATNSLAQYMPDLLIVEIGMRKGNGMEFIRKTRLNYPDVRLLIYTTQDENLYAERALRIGAHGFLVKSSDRADFEKALHAIMHGNFFVSANIEDRILRGLVAHDEDEIADPERVLSNRELEIFVKIGEGMSSKDIAAHLGISVKTVETHRAHIKRKLNTHSAGELKRKAAEWTARTYA